MRNRNLPVYLIASFLVLIVILGCSVKSPATSDGVQTAKSDYLSSEPTIEEPTQNEFPSESGTGSEGQDLKEENPVDSEARESESTGELPTRTFSIKDLEAEINRITSTTNVLREDNNTEPYIKELRLKNHVLYTSNNQFKGWVIEHINSTSGQLESMADFYDYVAASNWQGWRYYINETEWHWLYRPLSEDELKDIDPSYNYETNYVSDTYSAWIDRDIYENILSNGEGSILEYELITMVISHGSGEGYWIGNWEPYQIIYKIPCTKDMIVYYRPMWGLGFGQIGHGNQKKETAMKNFMSDLTAKQPETLDYSEQIMKFCGIDEGSFKDADFENYESHDVLVHNWKVYFGIVFNHSVSADVKIEPTNRDNETFRIKSINYTFTCFERETDLETLRLNIQLDTDGRIDDYFEGTVYSEDIFPGESKNVVISVNQDEVIRKNTSIILSPRYKNKDETALYTYPVGKPLIIKLT